MNKLVQVPRKFLKTLLILSLLRIACGLEEQQAIDPRVISAKLQTLQQATLIDSSNYVGTLEARQRFNLASSHTSWHILRIFAKEGDIPYQGQTLVEI